MNAPQPCPHPDDLLRDQLGELPVHRSVALQAHVNTCAACAAQRAIWRRLAGDLALADDLAGPSSTAEDGSAFVARVEAAVREEMRRPRAKKAASPLLWAWWQARRAPAFTALAMAVAAALVLIPLALVRDTQSPFAGKVTARGRGAPEGARGAEVLVLHEGHLQPLDGQEVCGTEALAVRVTNLSGRPVHLMAFGRDAAGEVHWLYPAYADARTNPSSVAIVDGANERVLDELVQPDAPVSGPIRFVTVLSAEPLRVKDVEARLAAASSDAPVASLFPGAMAREQRANCEARR